MDVIDGYMSTLGVQDHHEIFWIPCCADEDNVYILDSDNGNAMPRFIIPRNNFLDNYVVVKKRPRKKVHHVTEN